MAAIKNGQKTPPTVHAAAICLYFDVVPADRRKSVERWFLANIDGRGCAVPVSRTTTKCWPESTRTLPIASAIDVIRKRWEPMTRFETGTTWEGFGPGENCHNMGAAPAIYLSRHVLGVQVDGPVANRRLVIEPRLGDLKRAEGVVVTEFGPVPVGWDRSGQNVRLSFDVEIPAGVTARVSLPRPSEKADLIIDGRTVHPSSDASCDFVTVELGTGKHHGTL